jgi:hypothetical protein
VHLRVFENRKINNARSLSEADRLLRIFAPRKFPREFVAAPDG